MMLLNDNVCSFIVDDGIMKKIGGGKIHIIFD